MGQRHWRTMPFTGGLIRAPMRPSGGFAPVTKRGTLNMRITFGLAAMASLCLLAGCNRGAANNSATANAPAAANEAEPAAAPANGPATAAPGNRENEIAECSADMTRNLPAGSDVAALCTCAVDRIAGGASQRAAVEQCATQLNIALPGAGGAAPGAAEGNSAE